MPNIQKVNVKAKRITGLQVSTNNRDEMSQETQKIAPLWKRFHDEILPLLEDNSEVYGLYHHYESDALGQFDVLVGTDGALDLEGSATVMVEEGRYLMFPVKGELSQAIKEGWQKVWAYFEDESIDERRAYATDFEKYISEDEAEIYIGVHYF